MSSESDLEYQSAAEDSESDTEIRKKPREKCETEGNSATSQIDENVINNVETEISQLDDSLNNPLDSALTALRTDEKAKLKQEDENLSHSSKCEGTPENVSKPVDSSTNSNQDDKPVTKENKKKEILDVSSDKAKESDAKICTASETTQQDMYMIKEDEKKKIFDVSTDKAEKSDAKTCAESETTQEKQRVVLRLEKLINQKQQISKESPVQKEKASDLVNILQDPYKSQQSSWGFSSWGSSLLSSAATSVSTFSSQVSQGIGTVFETVESSLGAPGPEELAKVLNERKKEENADKSITDDGQTSDASVKDDGQITDTSVKDDDQTDAKLSLLPNVSFWTKAIESTGSKVIMGGLDTLEFIGKKTMTILTEGDPGLRKKRAAFSDGANLSEILREAKAKAEQDHENNPENVDSIHYSQVFDEKQGLVHLEALEMLSKLSQAKFQRLLMRHSKNVEVKKNLEEIKSICENLPSFDDPSGCETFDDFENVFKKHSIELSLPINVENIIKTQRQIHDSICKYENASEDSENSPKEIFQSAICSLAEFTAKSIETFHKITELILVQPRLDQDIEHCATNLTGLTTVMCIEINNLSTRYHKCLDLSIEHVEKSVDTTTLATNLYVEAANSNNYIQDAYQMIVPILQVCVLEALEN